MMILVLRLPVMLLLALLALASPAHANHDEWGDEDPSSWVDEAEDAWDEPVPAEPVPAEQPAVPAVGQDQWDDPATIDDWPVPGDGDLPRPADPNAGLPPLVKGKVVAGKVARLRADGRAAIPRGAPQRVRRTIRALNEIVGKPYKWGGGHGSLLDRGYDCSGAVGYGLIRTGLMASPMVSGQMARWGSSGPGRWITLYAHSGHVYMEIAGLRLDTSPVGDPARRSGVRWRPLIGRRGGFKARHPAGL